MRTVLVDYGMGNLASVNKALQDLGAKPTIADDPSGLAAATSIVLPGVGSFCEAMERLAASSLADALVGAVGDGVPLLGICLGMQLLADFGEEGGGCTGLGLIPGRVVRMPARPNIRVPHVGWNEVRFRSSDALLVGLESAADFYFVHSYHFVPEDPDVVLGTTPHGSTIASLLRQGTIIGSQFHPEKSSTAGRILLRNFLSLTEDA